MDRPEEVEVDLVPPPTNTTLKVHESNGRESPGGDSEAHDATFACVEYNAIKDRINGASSLISMSQQEAKQASR